MSDLLKLAERVEALEGPDREVDCLIADFMKVWPDGWIRHLPGMGGASWAYHNPAHNGEWMEAPAYTASLDAAMTLIDGNSPFEIVREATRRLGRKFDLHMCFWPKDQSAKEWLARYITAAALRARTSQPSSHDRKDGE